MSDPKSTLEIRAYVHCGLCLRARPENFSPRDWSDLEVGFTPTGIQVWCKRHNCNVVNASPETGRLVINNRAVPPEVLA